MLESNSPESDEPCKAETETTPLTSSRQRSHESSSPRWSRVAIAFGVVLLAVIGCFFRMAHTGRWRYAGQQSPRSEEVLIGQTCAAVDPIQALKKTTTLEGLKNGAVASDHAVCSEMGNSILQQGGNAVDAAVTVMLCLGVANPASSGLGGGAFILIHSESSGLYQAENPIARPPFHDERDQDISLVEGKITEIIDAREIAPAAASEDMFLKSPLEDASIIGGLSIGVPGELRGLELAHARHGKLPWATVVEPAMRLAQDGVPVTKMLSFEIAFATAQLKYHGHSNGEFTSLRRLITKDDNWSNGLKEGDILKNPQLAKTLRLVMEKGSDALYTGENAKNLIADIRAEGGILTEEDLHGYRPTLRSPLVAEANGFNMVGVPPPSSGGATVIGAARFLSGYSSPFASAADTLSIHRMVEAMRHAFAIRMSLSDPAFNSNVTRNAVRDLVSGPYMESLRKLSKDNDTLTLSQYGGKRWGLLDDDDAHTHGSDHHDGDRHTRRKGLRRKLLNADGNKRRILYRPFGYLEDSGTSHLSVVDKDGNAVSVTSSINTLFGSSVCSESTGVILGNTMDDFGTPGKVDYFGLQPAESNFAKGGKKPLSSMAPTMVFKRKDDGDNGNQLVLVLGGSGGPKIVASVLQVMFNFCMMGLPLFDSVALPRTQDQLLYHGVAATLVERMQLLDGPLLEVPNRTKEALLKRGHESLISIDYTGTVQAVSVDLETNTLSAVSDIRKGGSPAGY